MKKWNIYSPKVPNTPEELIEILLRNRNITTKEKAKDFLNPQLKSVTIESVELDPHAVKKAVRRIKEAITKNERIIIFGDYDVDGITGTAILWETIFWNLGYKNVHPYIPHRVNEGYGISKKGIDSVLSEYPDTKLIITVDNGIVAIEPTNYAVSKNIEVIVTDHHAPKDELPRACAIVHTTKICGASVALLLSIELEGKKLDVDDSRLDLTALATVADLVPLVDQNRVLLSFGLKALGSSKRPGIQALCEQAGIDQKKIGVYEIGHMIAPRLNASGRLDHALDSLRIICTKNRNKARIIAQSLSTVNKQRQTMTEELILHARQTVQFDDSTKIIISSSEKYNLGIVGLVASRLTELFYRPSLVIAKGEEISKGSARSIKGVNIIELIRSASSYLIEAGGHPMAAGFALRTEHLELFVEEISQKAKDISEDNFRRSISVDCKLNRDLITEQAYKKIQELAPFGMGNYEPLFILENIEVISIKKIGKDLNHLSLKLKIGKNVISAIKFGIEEEEKIPVIGEKIDVVFLFSINEWNGSRNIQLVVRDFRIQAPTVNSTLN